MHLADCQAEWVETMLAGPGFIIYKKYVKMKFSTSVHLDKLVIK